MFTLCRRTITITVVAAVAVATLTGCTLVQDTFSVGQREFRFDSTEDANTSRASFRFQGFLPDHASDIRLRAQLDGHATAMRWSSPMAFSSEYCETGTINGSPSIETDWWPEEIPTEGWICGSWSIVQDGDVHYAWNDVAGDDHDNSAPGRVLG